MALISQGVWLFLVINCLWCRQKFRINLELKLRLFQIIGKKLHAIKIIILTLLCIFCMIVALHQLEPLKS